MRLLLYKAKSSAFFVGLEIPSSVQLSKLEKAEPELSALLFGSDDGNEGTRRVSREKLVELGRDYLERNVDQKKCSSPVSVQVERDGQVIRGPATGMTGLLINGLFSSASVEDDGVEIRIYSKETNSFKESMIYGNVLPVDGAELKVNYSRGSGAYAFISQLTKSVATQKTKTIWMQVEH